MPDQGKAARAFINAEFGNAVVTAIRRVQKLSAGVDGNLCSGVLPRKSCRKSGDLLNGSVDFSVIRKHRDRRVELP